MKKIKFTSHALSQLKERNLSEKMVVKIFNKPGQIIDSYNNRKIAQKIIKRNKESFLARVIFEETPREILILTVYLTTKIDKYWRLINEN